jgi:hypothetical protein
MKKTIIISIIATLPILIMATMPERSSSGAPASHTGAPGETTCATSGCHDDHAINSGSANLTIEVAGGITNYIPGHTYPVKIKIADADVERFGFQITALSGNDNLMAGAFEIADNKRTQLVKNEYKLSDRTYVTYTFNGTDAVSTGVGEWTLNWTAPMDNVGIITFYAGVVSADDDMSDKGDYVYTTSVSILN